jgi:hypothetical protein
VLGIGRPDIARDYHGHSRRPVDIDTAVERAIEERLARIPHPLPLADRLEVDALFDRLAQMPVRAPRTPDEIIGYGSDGVLG